MKQTFLLITIFFQLCCKAQNTTETHKANINKVIDQWHLDAAKPNFKNYFDAMHQESVFIGTDATENWNKEQFMTFAKPFFDRGKAWNFTSLQRNIYFSEDKKTAWFDELLNTQMKICRSSGVLIDTENGWKIKHYVLSMTIPNDNSDEVVKLKTLLEDKEILKLKNLGKN